MLLFLNLETAHAQIVYTQSQYPNTTLGYAQFGLELVDSTATTKTYHMYLNLPSGISHVNYGSIWAWTQTTEYFYHNNQTGNSSDYFTVGNNETIYLQWITDYDDGTWESYEGSVSAAELPGYAVWNLPNYE
jgi:hypothetical protein